MSSLLRCLGKWVVQILMQKDKKFLLFPILSFATLEKFVPVTVPTVAWNFCHAEICSFLPKRRRPSKITQQKEEKVIVTHSISITASKFV